MRSSQTQGHGLKFNVFVKTWRSIKFKLLNQKRGGGGRAAGRPPRGLGCRHVSEPRCLRGSRPAGHACPFPLQRWRPTDLVVNRATVHPESGGRSCRPRPAVPHPTGSLAHPGNGLWEPHGQELTSRSRPSDSAAHARRPPTRGPHMLTHAFAHAFTHTHPYTRTPTRSLTHTCGHPRSRTSARLSCPLLPHGPSSCLYLRITGGVCTLTLSPAPGSLR